MIFKSTNTKSKVKSTKSRKPRVSSKSSSLEDYKDLIDNLDTSFSVWHGASSAGRIVRKTIKHSILVPLKTVKFVVKGVYKSLVVIGKVLIGFTLGLFFDLRKPEPVTRRKRTK